MFQPKNIMSGGDYISSSYLTQQSVPSSAISYSSLLYILSTAHLSSFADIVSLTQAQLMDIAKVIQTRIDFDNTLINQNNLSIAQILHILNDAGGLQDQYNAASTQFGTELDAWVSTSTSIVTKNALLIQQQAEYSTLYLSSLSMGSTISTLELQYSTMLLEYMNSPILLNEYTTKYDNEMKAYISNIQVYNSTQSLLMKNISELNYYSTASTNANMDYFSTSTGYNMMNYDYNTYSTSIGRAVNILTSTQKFYSTIIQDKNNTKSLLEQNANLYNTFILSISSQMTSSIQNIAIQSRISTKYALDNIAYQSNLKFYSTMEPFINSTIRGYNLQINDITQQISTLILLSTISTSRYREQMSTFYSQANQYYDYKAEDTKAIMEQYIYDIRLFDLKARQCAANLVVKKSDNNILMTSAYIQSQNLANSPDKMTEIQNYRFDLLNTNVAIDSIIINILNPFDRMFYDILNIAFTESTMKGQFIQQRKAIFNTYEYPSLQQNSTLISSMYFRDMSALNALVTTINSNIRDKNLIHTNINTILTPNISTITGIIGINWFSSINRYPGTSTLLLEPTSGTSMTEYGVIPPIRF
uniref:Uncharacterized protein n=1 Tax=viral metagenome TaxID=1070528 RepID=A0A6C0DCJ8_9ZZZZ